MLTDTHPAFAYHARLAYALSQGKVAITFRKVTDNRNRTMIASRSESAIRTIRNGVASDLHQPNPVVVEFLPDGSSRLRSFYPSEVVSWMLVGCDDGSPYGSGDKPVNWRD
jgi:hypothetical protein